MCGCIKQRRFGEIKKIPCKNCHGTGNVPTNKLGPRDPCPHCHGSGKVPGPEIFKNN